jgi:hypothetical protein
MERKQSSHRGGADRHYLQSAFAGLKPIALRIEQAIGLGHDAGQWVVTLAGYNRDFKYG